MNNSRFLPDPPTKPLDTGANATRSLRQLAVGSVLTIIATVILVSSTVFWSALRSDQVTKERHQRIVGAAIARSLEQIPYDQQSVAIWDESVSKVRNGFDHDWVEANLGLWMHSYFKHDRVYVIDADGATRYAMADGASVSSPAPRPDLAVGVLVMELKHLVAAGALDDFQGKGETLPRVVDLAFVEGRPAIVSVLPLVSDTLQISQERGTEWVMASVRFLDGSFLQDLSETYLLDGVRFSAADDISSRENSASLVTRRGATLGHLVWLPRLPGWTILADILPVIALGLAAIGTAVLFLIRSLRTTYAKLVVSDAQSKLRAYHDTLTGLPNRAQFSERLDTLLAEAKTSGRPIALMFLDLDRFKHVNDSLGHAAGDEVIRMVASRVTALLGEGDLLARIGGDEFAVIKVDAADRGELESFCLATVAAVTRPFDIHGHQANVGISIGIALTADAGTNRSELARKADIALYEAKNGGGQRFRFFTEEMGKAMQERRALERDLREALDSGGQLEVVYQPLITTTTREVTGAEALARWKHPRLGDIPPSTFIPIAEECGLIDRLGVWILREACKTAAAWDIATLAVNVSSLQFRHQDFADRVLAIAAQSGFAPERLEIEITEAALDGNSKASMRALKALRQAGVRIALDDFGTGHSSLSMLLRLEADRVKIDQSFVKDCGLSASSSSIVQALVTMAHAVGLAVTGEGVETREQQNFLALIGCDTLQGYLYSPPLSAQDFAERLEAGPIAKDDVAA